MVQATVPELVLVAEDPRQTAQLTRVVLPQPPLEQQQQVGDRVALVGGAQVHLHLGEERNLEAGSDQQLEVANSCGVYFDSRTRARCCRPSAAVTCSAGAGCAGVPGKCFIVVKLLSLLWWY